MSAQMLDPIGPPMKCGTCGYPLESRETRVDDLLVEFGYEHIADRGCTLVVPIEHDPETDMDVVGVCDFCSRPGVRWMYPAANFVTFQAEAANESLAGGSVGAWGACSACHQLIDAGDRVGLTERSYAELTRGEQRSPREQRDVMQMLTALHEGFHAHRTGEAVRRW